MFDLKKQFHILFLLLCCILLFTGCGRQSSAAPATGAVYANPLTGKGAAALPSKEEIAHSAEIIAAAARKSAAAHKTTEAENTTEQKEGAAEALSQGLQNPQTMTSETEPLVTVTSDAGTPATTTSTAAAASPTTATTAPADEPLTTATPDIATPSALTISFAGDVMLATKKNMHSAGDFNEYARINEPHYFFDGVREIFQSDDYTIVNLENVFTDQNLPEREKPENPAYWYRSRTTNAEILTQSGIEMVSLGNNHVKDYGDPGYRDTVAALKENGILYGENGGTVYLEKNGIRVAVICTGLWNENQTGNVIKLVETAALQSDFQIVFYHGGTENTHEPDEWRKSASRRLVDAGADCVVGNHPHVLQPMEKYKGVDILYSLGNFLFGGMRYPENRTMIYQLVLTADPSGVTCQSRAIPCYVYTGESNNYQPAVITDETQRQHVLDFLDSRRSNPF